jgi:hypothetical protein
MRLVRFRIFLSRMLPVPAARHFKGATMSRNERLRCSSLGIFSPFFAHRLGRCQAQKLSGSDSGRVSTGARRRKGRECRYGEVVAGCEQFRPCCRLKYSVNLQAGFGLRMRRFWRKLPGIDLDIFSKIRSTCNSTSRQLHNQ